MATKSNKTITTTTTTASAAAMMRNSRTREEEEEEEEEEAQDGNCIPKQNEVNVDNSNNTIASPEASILSSVHSDYSVHDTSSLSISSITTLANTGTPIIKVESLSSSSDEDEDD